MIEGCIASKDPKEVVFFTFVSWILSLRLLQIWSPYSGRTCEQISARDSRCSQIFYKPGLSTFVILTAVSLRGEGEVRVAAVNGGWRSTSLFVHQNSTSFGFSFISTWQNSNNNSEMNWMSMRKCFQILQIIIFAILILSVRISASCGVGYGASITIEVSGNHPEILSSWFTPILPFPYKPIFNLVSPPHLPTKLGRIQCQVIAASLACCSTLQMVLQLHVKVKGLAIIMIVKPLTKWDYYHYLKQQWYI